MLIKKNAKKQINKRKKYINIYHKLLCIKLLLKNSNFNNDFKTILKKFYLKKYNNINSASLNRYCLRTSNFKSVYQQFKLNRQPLKYLANQGKIPGLFKK